MSCPASDSCHMEGLLEPIVKLEVVESSVNTEKMPPKSRRSQRVSLRQVDMLWQFLNSHRDIASAFNRSLQEKEYSHRKWREFARILNAQGDGAYKDGKGWCKYWVDYKAKLKYRVAATRSSQKRTGGGPSTDKPLNDIDEKFLQILGHDFGQGSSGVRLEPATEPLESGAATVEVQESESILPNFTSPTPPAPIIPSQSTIPPSPSQSTIPATPPVLPATPPPSRLSPRPPLRRRRENPLPLEARRRALIRASQSRAEASVKSSNALERIADALEGMQSSLARIERKRKKPQPTINTCPQCDKVFGTPKQLKTHIRSHTGERPYICAVCGKTYTQLGHLSDHSLVHSGLKPYHCTHCNKAFYRRSELDRHEKIHTGDKPYPCDMCGKSFAQKNNLIMHVKAHNDDRQHECSVCKKRFITRSKLMLHANKHKKKKKWDISALVSDVDVVV